MDPNTTLAEMREHARAAAQGEDVRRNERELRHKFEDFDEWRSKGGFDPWTPPRRIASAEIVSRKWEVNPRDGAWYVDQHVRESGRPWESGTRGDSIACRTRKEANQVAGALNSAYVAGQAEAGRDTTASVSFE